MTHRLRAIAIALVVISTAWSFPRIATVDADSPSLNGGGSSFAKLEIDQWRAEVARQPYDLDINYVAQGSSFGRQQYAGGGLEFAASDIPFPPNELPAVQNGPRGDFVYVPVSAGGLGFMYHLADQSGQPVTTLNLSPRTVCRIFTDDTVMWDDPEILGLNPGLALPNQRVLAIVRADGSGTSYVLSQFCMATSPDVWAAFIAAEQTNASADLELLAGHPTSLWPTNRFGSANAADGVAAAVADSGGIYSITYNEAGFAKIRGFPNANMQNAAGQFTQPTERAVSIALGYATGRPDGTFDLDFQGTDPEAYFPSTYSYVIAQTTGFDPAKGEVLARFLCYAITRGQRVELTEALGYARLSAPLVELGKTAIAQIPGAPPWEQCRVESAAPPPAAVPDETTDPGATDTGSGATGSGATGTGATGTGSGATGSGSSATGSGSGAAGSSASGSGATGAATTGTTLPGASNGATSSSTDTGTCVDPLTGLTASCDSLGVVDDSGDGTASGTGGATGATRPAAKNPQTIEDDGGPTSTQILWWLLQGASVCALGVALAGAKRRFA